MESDLKGMVEARMATMRGILESGREAMPMVFLIAPDGKSAVIGISEPLTIEIKEQVMDLVAGAVRERDATAIMLVDAWTTDAKTGVRQEAIIASVFGKGQETELAVWKYRRDPFRWEQVEWGQGRGTMAPDFKGEARIQ